VGFEATVGEPTVLQTDDTEAVTWASAVPATYVRTHSA
jgi:hypothetical protein